MALYRKLMWPLSMLLCIISIGWSPLFPNDHTRKPLSQWSPSPNPFQ